MGIRPVFDHSLVGQRQGFAAILIVRQGKNTPLTDRDPATNRRSHKPRSSSYADRPSPTVAATNPVNSGKRADRSNPLPSPGPTGQGAHYAFLPRHGYPALSGYVQFIEAGIRARRDSGYPVPIGRGWVNTAATRLYPRRAVLRKAS